MDNQAAYGESRTHKGQVYVCIGTKEVRRGGRLVKVLRGWESICSECGGAFRFSVLAWRKDASPNRRCMLHVRHGKRAKNP